MRINALFRLITSYLQSGCCHRAKEPPKSELGQNVPSHFRKIILLLARTFVGLTGLVDQLLLDLSKSIINISEYFYSRLISI